MSITLFLLELFRDITEYGYAVLVRLPAEQLHTRGQPLGAKTTVQLVSSAYTASCKRPSRNGFAVGRSVLMKKNGLRASMEIAASSNVYGEGRTRHDVAMIHNDDKHNNLKNSDQILVWSGRVLALAGIARVSKTKNHKGARGEKYEDRERL